MSGDEKSLYHCCPQRFIAARLPTLPCATVRVARCSRLPQTQHVCTKIGVIILKHQERHAVISTSLFSDETNFTVSRRGVSRIVPFCSKPVPRALKTSAQELTLKKAYKEITQKNEPMFLQLEMYLFKDHALGDVVFGNLPKWKDRSLL